MKSMDQQSDRVFFDANVLIEIVDKRLHQVQAMKAIQQTRGQLYISTLSSCFVVYIGGKHLTLNLLEVFLSDFTMLSLEPEDVRWAFDNIRNTDFEDALQLAVAIRNGCTEFVTFDAKLARTYGDLIKIKLLKP